MKQDRNLLAEHGTVLMTLKPSSLIQAARADLKRKARNADIATRQHELQSYEQYAFHRSHVRKAVDVQDLLVRAIMEPGVGISSGKFNTRLLYSDGALLREAIMMLGQEN